MNGKPGSDNRKPRKKRILRIERQEHPNDSPRSAVEHKLSFIRVAIASCSGAT